MPMVISQELLATSSRERYQRAMIVIFPSVLSVPTPPHVLATPSGRGPPVQCVLQRNLCHALRLLQL